MAVAGHRSKATAIAPNTCRQAAARGPWTITGTPNLDAVHVGDAAVRRRPQYTNDVQLGNLVHVSDTEITGENVIGITPGDYFVTVFHAGLPGFVFSDTALLAVE